MTLKAILPSLDGLSEDLRAHYTERDSGGFILAVEPVSGFALEDVAGLKTTSEDRKSKHAKAQAELAALKESIGDLDIDKARAALEKKPSDDKRTFDERVKEHTDAIRKELADKHSAEMDLVGTKSAKYRTQAEALLIDSEVARLLTKEGLKGSFRLLRDPVRKRVKVDEKDDGTLGLSILQADGQPMYAPKGSTVEPAGLEDLLKSLREDEEYQRAFDGTGASGGGATGAGRSVSGNKQAGNMSLPPSERLAAHWESNGAGQ